MFGFGGEKSGGDRSGGEVVAKKAAAEKAGGEKSGGAEMWTLRPACVKVGTNDDARYRPVYAGGARSGIL